jgi:hypothetical protein
MLYVSYPFVTYLLTFSRAQPPVCVREHRHTHTSYAFEQLCGTILGYSPVVGIMKCVMRILVA